MTMWIRLCITVPSVDDVPPHKIITVGLHALTPPESTLPCISAPSQHDHKNINADPLALPRSLPDCCFLLSMFHHTM